MRSNFSKFTATTLLYATLQTQLIQPQQLSAAEALQFNRHQMHARSFINSIKDVVDGSITTFEKRQVLGALNGEELATVYANTEFDYVDLENRVTAAIFKGQDPPYDPSFTFFLDGVKIEPGSVILSEGKLTAILAERNRLWDWLNNDSQESLISDADMEVWARKNLGLGENLTIVRPNDGLSPYWYVENTMFRREDAQLSKTLTVELKYYCTDQEVRRAFDEFEKLLEHDTVSLFEMDPETQSDSGKYEKQRDAYFTDRRNRGTDVTSVYINAHYVGRDKSISIVASGDQLSLKFEIRKG